MDRQRSFLPYQVSPNSTTPQPNVRIVEDLSAALAEVEAQQEAQRRIDQFHLRGLSAALVRYALITKAVVEGGDDTLKALVPELRDS
ncbi:MAG: hypothetical protein OXF39_05850 [Nitrospira sp.]|nr:hypothetical protein [Nitrospira sp.]